MHGFFERFSRLHKSCHKAIEVAFEVLCVYKQHLIVTFVYQYDDGSGQLRPHLLATRTALLAYLRVHSHRCAADSAVFGISVPVEQFFTLARFQIQVVRQLIVARPKAAHLISFRIGYGFGYAVSLHRHAVQRCHVHNVRARFYVRGRFSAVRHGIASVGQTLHQQVAAAKHKVEFVLFVVHCFLCARRRTPRERLRAGFTMRNYKENVSRWGVRAYFLQYRKHERLIP